MVILGDPVPPENPALTAVTMALEMRAAIGALIERWRPPVNRQVLPGSARSSS
jgi:hypothetical protein